MSVPALLTVFAAALSAPAHAQEAPPIIDGDLTADFEAVGGLVALDSRGRGANYCSGTLVDDNWVVTAAHCVEGSAEFTSAGFDLYFMVGTDIFSRSGITDYAIISNQTAHPSYSSRTLEHDIAVLELGGRGITTVDPMPMRQDSIGRGDRGTDVTYVGWGIDDDRGSGSGYKRTVDVPIYDTYGGILITHDTSGSRNICSGDSGGAALMPAADGTYELAAVNSFGFMLDGSSRVLCDDPDAAAGAWRVDYDYDWVVDVIGYEPDVEGTEAADGSGGTGDDGGGTDGGDDGGTDGSGDDGSTDGGTDGLDDETATEELDEEPMEFGATDSEGDVKAGCSAVGAAPALGLAALGMLGLARRRED